MDMSIRFPNLNITLDHVGKTIDVFGFEIAYYGIIIGLGMLLGVWFVIIEAKRTNQNQDLYLDLLILSIICGIVGARAYYVFFSWDNYKDNLLEIFNTRHGGLAIYGGIIGAVLAAYLFTRFKKMSFWQVGDTACLGLLTGQIIGRWGNFFNREAFGDYSDGLLSMQLPVSAVRQNEITETMWNHLAVVDGIEYIQVHPTFLYESLWNLALLLLLMAYRRKKKFQGELFLLYLAGYGLGRSWIEGLRTDQLLIPGMGIPVSQVLSVVLVLACTAAIILKRSMAKKRRAIAKGKWEPAEEEEELTKEELEVLQEELAKENEEYFRREREAKEEAKKAALAAAERKEEAAEPEEEVRKEQEEPLSEKSKEECGEEETIPEEETAREAEETEGKEIPKEAKEAEGKEIPKEAKETEGKEIPKEAKEAEAKEASEEEEKTEEKEISKGEEKAEEGDGSKEAAEEQKAAKREKRKDE